VSPLSRSTYGYPPVVEVFNLDRDDKDAWEEALNFLAGYVIEDADLAVRQILEIVRHRGCQTIVHERGYLDPDYRSEYSAFWSGRFEDRDSKASRAHFFQARFTADDLPTLTPTGLGYLGYTVLRPTELGLVGRTVIAPPDGLKDARLSFVVERPNLFGASLEVAGVPFYQQDGEFLRCAHAVAWLCHYVAVHHRVIGRRLTAEIASMPSVDASKHRPLPSNGLSGEQLQGVFSSLGIPAFFYDIADLPALPAPLEPFPKISVPAQTARVMDQRMFRVVCKYLNSGFPVVVLTEGKGGSHAFTLVGWKTIKKGEVDKGGTTRREDGVRLIACDDRLGPYETIDSPTADSNVKGQKARGQWKSFMLPLPAKVYLTGEAAESRARQIIAAEAQLGAADPEDEAYRDGLAAIAKDLEQLGGGLSIRSRLIEGRRYKAVASRQERDPNATRIVRMSQLPHWIWLVEVQDREAREKEQPCVVAEMVFDSTSHDERPAMDLLSTTHLIFDVNMAEDEDEDGASEDQDASTLEPAGARLDGRRWRSAISDPTVPDREYGLEVAPPGSVAGAPDEEVLQEVDGSADAS
jgi:hypothetical protein